MKNYFYEELYHTLFKDIKDLSKYRIIPCSRVGRFNKDLNLFQIYKFKAIVIKILSGFLMELDSVILHLSKMI